MDTRPLERFATHSRRELLAAVDAQATAVLSAGSVARTEQAETVKRLEEELAAHGRDHVIDKVAYTWFNRIIALRFMDAKGYTDAGIVSPAQGQPHGQPEILADAKRGDLDSDIVTNRRTAEAITGLLEGFRRSPNAEGEAYALLLTEYCRYWHQSMPFMFEREGDYTDLLVPTGLLADGSILSRAREVLTEEVCDDVEVIGWLYQFYISERKKEVFDGFSAKGTARKLAGPDEIPAATQLFTPHWIVRYLVENSIGRLWMLNRPGSHLVDQMDYYVAAVDDETDYLTVNSPEELTVIDPACGSGHMLTYAFDLLYLIYEEEGYAPSEIPNLILAHNLHGTEIDPRAASLAAFALTMKARGRQQTFFGKRIEPKICIIEPISFGPEELDLLISEDGDRRSQEAFWNQFTQADLFGSLIQPSNGETIRAKSRLDALGDQADILHARTLAKARRSVTQAEYLGSRYGVAVTNPPYMGSGNMQPILSNWLALRYPDSKSDLMTAFMERASALVSRAGGFWAMINIPSWMFLSSYEKLRAGLLAGSSISSLVHLGRGVFGPDFGSVAFVIRAQPPRPGQRGLYRRLFREHVNVRTNAEIKRLFLDSAYQSFEVDQSGFEKIPGQPIAYWVDRHLIDLYDGALIGEKFDIKAGVGTRNDDVFMRFHWEVALRDIGRGRRWILTDKAGEFRKWYAGFVYVMDWENDGYRIRNYRNPDGSLKSRPQNVQYLFREGITWGKVGAGATSFRWRPEGHGFNDAAPAIFGPNVFDLLAQLNTNLNKRLVEIKGSTVNVQTGMIAELPIIEAGPEISKRLSVLARRAVEISVQDWNSDETSIEFSRPAILSREAIPASLRDLSVRHLATMADAVESLAKIESEIELLVRKSAGVPESPGAEDAGVVSLRANPAYRYGRRRVDEFDVELRRDLIADLISYAVGCMFGRYSLDEPGLILADHAATLNDYLARVPTPTYRPDVDNVIPLVDDSWFEDDIVERLREFLRTCFGFQHFEENLRFVEECLGVRSLRDYFIVRSGKSKFYDDHVQRYRRRPIYWMFSSPNGSFNALIYMHRYSPSTVSVVLNEYLREYRGKLEVALSNLAATAGEASATTQKEADRLRKVLAELRDYEHDVLYPLATQQVAIDLDDGVSVNYPKFYPALRRIIGLERSE